MGILQEVSGIRDAIERGVVHALGPGSSPGLIEHVILATPDEVNRFGPAQQDIVMVILGSTVTTIIVVKTDLQRKSSKSIVAFVGQAIEGR